MSVLFNKGILMIFIGIIIIINSLLYLYYYKINQLPNDTNKISNKLFGPQLLLVSLIIMYLFIFIYHGYSFLMYFNQAINNKIIENNLVKKCQDYITLKGKIAENIKNKTNEKIINNVKNIIKK